MKFKVLFYLFFALLGIACFNAPVMEHHSKAINYHEHISPIIENFCLTCHAGNNPAAQLNLSSYEQVRYQTEQGDLLTRINDEQQPMPQGGLMPQAQRTLIENWAKGGFKKGMIAIESDTINQKKEMMWSKVTALAIKEKEMAFLTGLYGHWVGKLDIMGQHYEWFSFDFRPISGAHVHAIYEGGTMGNIMTSFFIANFQGKKTLMARNGGILNGIFRMSYFVLDKIEQKGEEQHFRFVDALGGADIMWMDLVFSKDKLHFTSYTSRFGANEEPKIHMDFKATSRKRITPIKTPFLFPQFQIEKDFSKGLPKPNWLRPEMPQTASYIFQDTDKNIAELGKMAKDPFDIKQLPYLSKLRINLDYSTGNNAYERIIYLSEMPLTDENGAIKLSYGYIDQKVFNSVLAFPVLSGQEKQFTFFYLHPGSYYITVVTDLNKDGYISKGDLASTSQAIELQAESHLTLDINH